MSFIKTSHYSMVALSALPLLFMISCSKEESNKENSIYAETMADCICEEGNEDNEKCWDFTVKFIAEEGEGIDGGETGGKPFKNRPIEIHTVDFVSQLKQYKGYKPGMKPLKYQKIKIKYEKTYPYNVGFLERFKYQDEQGNIVELK